ncbi:MAG: ester cyclase [Pseudomonadota bacterium]
MSNSKPQIVSAEDHMQTHWTQQEKDNVATVLDFFQYIMNEHDFDYTLSTYGGGSYLQHNRGISDGVAGVVGYVKTLTKRFPEYGYDVKMAFADGDYVVVHSHATLRASHRGNERKGFIITDTFRLKDGKLAEHWDAIQPIDLFARFVVLMNGGTVANSNATFTPRL